MDLFRFTSGKVDWIDCREKYLYTNNGTMKKRLPYFQGLWADFFLDDPGGHAPVTYINRTALFCDPGGIDW
jgi:hypothetical protein